MHSLVFQTCGKRARPFSFEILPTEVFPSRLAVTDSDKEHEDSFNPSNLTSVQSFGHQLVFQLLRVGQKG
jgi:hypothetical protein